MKLELAKPKGAIFSKCKKYRYALWRRWDVDKPIVMFVMLNPSTADAETDDPTLRRCIGFAKDWGYGGVLKTNLFAYRATDYRKMLAAKDPVGKENIIWLKKAHRKSDLLVAAWGNHGQHLEQDQAIFRLFKDWHYLKLNKSGVPAHPLYLRKDLVPSKF